MRPAPMEEIERTNTVVIRGQGQDRVWEVLLDKTPILWK